MEDFIYAEAMRCKQKYDTCDPYVLLDKMKVNFKKTFAYPKDGLKGYCTIMNRSMYVRVNGNLDEPDQKISATHEAGHLNIHQHIILSNPSHTLHDYELYSIKNRYESEANFFVADFLISDTDVMLFALELDMDYSKIACSLCVPLQILNFKLYSMKQRGFPVTNPEPLDSKFLKK